ncbi:MULTISPECIES: protein kinase domain-containing protein [unclassified Chamaesiphon]|uniref:protein kinase domain-containing protein n=1 Tax=unclassified Chamaesiphon TaxID=2620921 RepID=UPI00286C2BE7|nr:MULTISPECIES: PsbP-related protein [unclassified Chamaesiphon]
MLGTILHSHYQIVKVLGIGKSGATYLVKDLDLIDSQFYVIKRIDYIDNVRVPSLTEQLFGIQCSIAHQLGKHPQIPTLITKFEVDGNRYLVREYIDGEPLSAQLTPGAIWSQTQTFDFLVELMEILKFFHSFKYIHQDINPHNIIRHRDNGKFYLIGYSCLKDLGSTWQIPENEARNLNDPSYVPYEQEQNIPKLTSDIYAVGAIAIQALTGRYPLEKDSHSYEIKWRDEVKIDLKLVEIINRMVRPDYRNRYQSADEVLQALHAFALTQIPASNRSKPYLLLGAAIGALVVGFSTLRFFLTSTNKPQLAASTVVATPNPPQLVTNSSGWQNYTNKTARIEVKYPTTWQQQDLANIVTGEQVIFTNLIQNKASKNRENISIRVENLTNPQTSLASYTQSTIAEISKYDRAAKIVESSPITVANRPGNLIVYTGRDENSLAVKNLEVWTIERGRAYIITYRATPDRYYQFLDTAMTIVNSFKIN